MKRILISLTFVLTCFGSLCCQENSNNYSQIFNEKFTGDIAYKTTGFVEQYWRVVGNSGFDSCIYEIERVLKKTGYVAEKDAKEGDRLTYKIEKRPLQRPTWEPLSGSLKIKGDEHQVLDFSTNRNMIAINSFSTPSKGIDAEVIYIQNLKELKATNVRGKIVFAEMSPWLLFNAAIKKGGAIGLLTYDPPSYLKPEINQTSIQFRTIPLDSEQKPWAIALSFAAKERLKSSLIKGKLDVHVKLSTRIYKSEELTIIANVKGSEFRNENLVLSAHVQEPGANDNATGVGVALEMAVISAQLTQQGRLDPKRTLTFLWGDEINSTRRYVNDSKNNSNKIRWGISLDMVGENTDLTGGSFLIEKMPDPSAIWTRGNDEHSEWGGEVLTLKEMKPHYLNDFVIHQFEKQGKLVNWEVKTNPFEGGSDHVPFLEGNIPSVLFWHFTDQFYHTDNDRLDKVSINTLKNVGISTLISAFTLLNTNKTTAKKIVEIVKLAGLQRLDEEWKQSEMAISKGESKSKQLKILDAWSSYYLKSISSCKDLVVNGYEIKEAIDLAKKMINEKSNFYKKELNN